MEPELRLLQDLESEVARWRRRTLFLVSVILHAVFIWILLFAPNLFRRGAEMMGINLQRARKPEATYLWLPPDVLKRLKEPPDTATLSDKNRRAQGRSPAVDPNGLRMPYLRGNTPLPELPGGGKPVPPAAPPPAGGASSNPAPAAPKPEDNQEARLRLMDVPAQPEGGGEPRLRLPLSTPSDAIRQAAQAAAARGRSGAGVPGPGEGTAEFENLHPNFSTEAPIILSDTQGVDFGPYLARVVYVVRRNWYQVIPESARLGEKGRVAIVFEILKDGSVPQLRVVGSSGLDHLDRAALNGIRASIPFPPLPTEFTGNHLVLQFIFLYNIGYTNP